MGERRRSPISPLHHPTYEMAQQCGGLIGLLIIEPREPPATAAPDAEYAL